MSGTRVGVPRARMGEAGCRRGTCPRSPLAGEMRATAPQPPILFGGSSRDAGAGAAGTSCRHLAEPLLPRRWCAGRAGAVRFDWAGLIGLLLQRIRTTETCRNPPSSGRRTQRAFTADAAATGRGGARPRPCMPNSVVPFAGSSRARRLVAKPATAGSGRACCKVRRGPRRAKKSRTNPELEISCEISSEGLHFSLPWQQGNESRTT